MFTINLLRLVQLAYILYKFYSLGSEYSFMYVHLGASERGGECAGNPFCPTCTIYVFNCIRHPLRFFYMKYHLHFTYSPVILLLSVPMYPFWLRLVWMWRPKRGKNPLAWHRRSLGVFVSKIYCQTVLNIIRNFIFNRDNFNVLQSFLLLFWGISLLAILCNTLLLASENGKLEKCINYYHWILIIFGKENGKLKVCVLKGFWVVEESLANCVLESWIFSEAEYSIITLYMIM